MKRNPIEVPIIIQVSSVGESLRNRCFYPIKGEKALAYLAGRIRREQGGEVILATSDHSADNVFEQAAGELGVRVYRGDYKDVLVRLKQTAEAVGAQHFVRLFANYPLCDLEQMKRLVRAHVEGGYEYSYNEHNRGVLWGTGCEVFSMELVNKLCGLKLTIDQRESLSFYLRQNEETYRIYKQEYGQERPSYKLFLETEKDLEVIREVAENVKVIRNQEIGEYLEKHKILSRYNLEEPAKEVGVEKLYLHPEKVSSILHGGENDTSYPISVELTLTNRCNLQCVYCSDMMLRERQGLGQTLEKDTLCRLFDDLAAHGTQGVVLEGGGEPTLYPDFDEIVRYARQAGLAVGLITNGTVRLEEDLLRQFEWIRVSLDASTAHEYSALKGVDCFERVMSNIAHYAYYCNTVGVGYVVTSRNVSQIEALVMRLRENGASYIQLRPVVDCDELYPYNIDLEYLRFYQTAHFGVVIDGMKENAQGGNHGLPCLASGLTSVISGDGSVYLCGRLNIYDWLKPIGNITRDSYYSIWNGEEHRKQAAMIRDGGFCEKNCPQCRISKFNQLFKRLEDVNSKHFI